jgi:hypothetical protein
LLGIEHRLHKRIGIEKRGLRLKLGLFFWGFGKINRIFGFQSDKNRIFKRNFTDLVVHHEKKESVEKEQKDKKGNDSTRINFKIIMGRE